MVPARGHACHPSLIEDIGTTDDDRDDFLVLLPDGTPVGHVALTGQNLVDGTARIELMLDPRHRGQGHGTAAPGPVRRIMAGVVLPASASPPTISRCPPSGRAVR
ncbi:GNAT family N-acetyltransferase [Streptomyces sp. WAC08241]|uniref:GNAT family N-acetyltransferase n=1 Tax=Streptomyces sp. WAC08241 TaxID=2487421 RepID=UPI000F77BA7A|nr:GNAT family N-acetyltransferase [Streptomyces sp. WAC08241]RSS39323.1 GNAT family N-acetyltransferase [Streptomyces sp. WAC08241]